MHIDTSVWIASSFDFSDFYYFGQEKFIRVLVNDFPILMGVGYMAVEYLTFNLANMITFNVMNSPEFLMIFVGAVIAVFGEAVGLLIRKVIKN